MLKYWILASCITIASSFIPLFILWLITGAVKNKMESSSYSAHWLTARRIILSIACGFLMIPHVEGAARGFIGPGWWYLTRTFSPTSWMILAKMGLLAMTIYIFKWAYDSRKKQPKGV